MKHLLLVSALLLAASIGFASGEENASQVSEREKQDFSEEYLAKANNERQNDVESRLATIREHNEYLKEIGHGHHR